MMKSYTYGVINCPECRADLSQQNMVHLFASVAGNIISVPTRLTTTGQLVDVDNLIKNGYHSSTECACYHPLNDYEVVFDPNLDTAQIDRDREREEFVDMPLTIDQVAGGAEAERQNLQVQADILDLERTKGDQL